MSDRIINIAIIALLIGCIFLGGRLGILHYIETVEEYNQSVLDFTVDMIKGNKTEEDIESANFSDNIKEDFIEYYKNNFYSENDFVVLFDDIDYLEKNKNRIKQEQVKYGEELLDSQCGYFSEFPGENLTEEENRYFKLSRRYIYLLEEEIDNRVFERDNAYCIYLKEIKGNRETILHKGLKLYINLDDLDKMTPEYRQNSEIYSTLENISNYSNEEEKTDILVYKNKFDMRFNVIYTKFLGRINSIIIE